MIDETDLSDVLGERSIGGFGVGVSCRIKFETMVLRLVDLIVVTLESGSEFESGELVNCFIGVHPVIELLIVVDGADSPGSVGGKLLVVVLVDIEEIVNLECSSDRLETQLLVSGFSKIREDLVRVPGLTIQGVVVGVGGSGVTSDGRLTQVLMHARIFIGRTLVV